MKTTATTKAELRTLCDDYERVPSKTAMPTPAEWKAFYAHKDRLEQLKKLG